MSPLIDDLKSRGLLEHTLIITLSEFGRTPQINQSLGRDHFASAWSATLTGRGIQGGSVYGKTDEFGNHAMHNRFHVHDLHATTLHLLGIDHEGLTYRYSRRKYPLTDVHGSVINDIPA